MKILFLGIDFAGLHGSFLHILEYSQYYIKKGAEVYAASVFITAENEKILKDEGINVYPLNLLPLDQEYDIVYALHLILFPALLYKGLKFHKAILMTLSKNEPIEMIPPSQLWPQFDLMAAISPEIIEIYQKDYGINKELLKFIPNHIPIPFLEKAECKQQWNKEIKKVCIVSNHYNQELEDMKNIAPFNISYFGSRYNNPVRITPELLLNFDVVITIGKTVQYCLGLGIPVYEYDKFGGCGFISLENIEREERTNFSGRGTRRKLNAEEIIQDINNNYQLATVQAQGLRRIAINRYGLDKLIEEQLKIIEKSHLPKPKLNRDAKLFCNACYGALNYIFRALRANCIRGD